MINQPNFNTKDVLREVLGALGIATILACLLLAPTVYRAFSSDYKPVKKGNASAFGIKEAKTHK